MEIGLIGLPQCGKTTIFNALTRGHASIQASGQSNVGVAKVPDPRLNTLSAMFNPKKTTPAEVKYTEVPAAPQGLGKSEGITGAFYRNLANVDAIMHVVRAFGDPTVPHVEGSVDMHRDISTMDMELTFADMALLEKRLERLKASLKPAKPGERDAMLRELALLNRIKDALGKDVPVREQSFTDDEARALTAYQFLTSKPLLLVVNIGEEDVSRAEALEKELGARYNRPGRACVVMCGKLEMELAQMSDADAAEFRQSMQLQAPGMERAIRQSYELLGYISFFTVGPDEVRAWTVRRGSTAPKAAGKIHSDLERGFIRAEVISADTLLKCGGLTEAKRQGLLRLEGKTYIPQDGDVMNILFSV